MYPYLSVIWNDEDEREKKKSLDLVVNGIGCLAGWLVGRFGWLVVLTLTFKWQLTESVLNNSILFLFFSLFYLLISFVD